MKTEFLSEAKIESKSQGLLEKFLSSTGSTLSAPVPIDRIAELFLDIPVAWDSIPSNIGDTIVSKITQPSIHKPCRIVMNEDLRFTLFVECPGLERTALAHEVGHHQLHIDHSHRIQMSMDFEPPFDIATKTNFLIEGIDKEGSEQAQRLRGVDADTWWKEWQAHTFMRFLLMPRLILGPVIDSKGLLTWTDLYELRNLFGVTISALVTHLSKLDYLRIDSNRRILDQRRSTSGQRPLLM